METLSLRWIAETLGLPPPANDFAVTGVCTDTRTIVPGSLFVALQGETFDGHDYILEAFSGGAVACLVEREVSGTEGLMWTVPDTLKALGDLAHAYRLRFSSLPVIAITGSVGKTSTKEMIAAVLRTKFLTLATEKNYNNEIGVPQTLFGLTSLHRAAVIEMGMRGQGEIARLAEIAEPTIALITNIGYAHIERLGSRENIAEAKTELFAALKPGSVAMIPLEDEFADTMLSRIPAGVRVIGVGNPDASHTLSSHVERLTPSRMPTLSVPGVHHLRNALFALAVANLVGIEEKDTIHALENWGGADKRMSVKKAGTLTILDDCYNAGVESMKAALETLKQMHPGGIAILGDMKELGDYASELHREVGRNAAHSDLRLLVTVGDLAREIAVGAGDIPHLHADTAEEVFALLKPELRPNDFILVKGSRAMAMEQIVQALISFSEKEVL